ncbi:MAG: hypothetical protein BGO26_18530 [Actinobacteria bacterium 69-20]|nr:PucR family transcriptional regulator [Actinomycetota bacterium]OJV24573.1 MAG: hypothetical protein BGO26_18530 [Actinobacteria bacterium 69-20]
MDDATEAVMDRPGAAFGGAGGPTATAGTRSAAVVEPFENDSTAMDLADGSADRRLTVADLLRLPVFARGRPEVLSGRDLDRRDVRWVHTSEIYEISPLLKGGEVLLTTGLGLVGASQADLRGYAVALAQRSIAALVLELGRTFVTAPEPLVAGAQESGLPLVTMRGIVPFVEITESVHALLISGEVARLRLAQRIDAVATGAVLSGAGLTAILAELATLADAPVRLYADDGHLVAASDARGGPRLSPTRALAEEDPAFPRAAVDLLARAWGHVVVCGAPTAARTLIADRGAVAIALELGRAGGGSAGPTRRRAGALLLRDLFGRQYSSIDEIVGRAAALGVVIRPGGRAAGICVAVDSAGSKRAGSGGARAGRSTPERAPVPAPAARRGGSPSAGGPGSSAPVSPGAAVSDAAAAVLGPSLVAELGGSYLIAASIDDDDVRGLLGRLADAIDAELPSGRAMAVTCGPLVGDFGSIPRSLRVAREASVLARRLHSDMRTLLCTDVGVHRLLSRFATDPELAAFVDEQLGPLLDYDAARGRELVRTLDTLLACGLSKAETARVLHIRRQTLYQRLETISGLLGGLDLDSRERRTSIDLALVGWRLRTAGVAPAANSPASSTQPG